MIFTGQSPTIRVILWEVEVLSGLSARVWFADMVELQLIVRISLISLDESDVLRTENTQLMIRCGESLQSLGIPEIIISFLNVELRRE